MAVFKPGATPPLLSERIDGCVYDYGQSTPQLRWWQSPREKYSPRFTMFDALAREADTVWKTMDEDTQREWTDRATPWLTNPSPVCLPARKFTICDLPEPYHDGELTFPTPGQSYHRAVYVINKSDGNTPPFHPPNEPWQYQQPHRDLDWGAGPTWTYYAESEHPLPTLRLIIYARAVPDPKKHMVQQAYLWKEIGRATAHEYLPCDLSAIWQPWAAGQVQRALQIMIAAAEPGDSPYVRWWACYPDNTMYIDNYPWEPP